MSEQLEQLRVRSSGLISRASISNLVAQGAALGSVTVASLLVARVGGPAVVGEYALFRVLPWLFGVVLSFGLPTASAYFLAGDAAKSPFLRPTLILMNSCGSAVGALAWIACSLPFHALFFKHVPLSVVVVMAFGVITQLSTVTAKGCCQGSHDIAGANLIIVAEELWFVLCFPVVVLVSHRQGIGAVVAGMIVAGILATITGGVRLAQKGFFEGLGRPSVGMAKEIVVFGARGQLGNLLWLTNLRFDFILLGALAGPSVLGVYSIASKFAELMRLAPTALNYVLYPRFAKMRREAAAVDARSLFPRALLLTLILTPFVAVVALFGPNLLYGQAFGGAVKPAEIIILGLSVEGAAAVASAYLLGTGRPGLNSIGMGVGAVLTVALDVVLIPRYGAIGGAITSAVVYSTATLTLSLFASHLWSNGADDAVPGLAFVIHQDLIQGADSFLRRAVDIALAASGLVLASPVLLLIAVGVKFSSPGAVIYRQVRVGRSGRPFILLKFRSMVVNAEAMGGYITKKDDNRVTSIGRLLRASKLDELPQLVNILRGEMTLIGPRPEVPYFVRLYNPSELAILAVRPGLTGLGQLSYTGDNLTGADDRYEIEERYLRSELHQKLVLDLAYLRQRGLRADLAIVGRTLGIILRNSKKTLLTLALDESQSSSSSSV